MLQKKIVIILIVFMIAGCGGKGESLPAAEIPSMSVTPRALITTRKFSPPVFILSPTSTPAPMLTISPATPALIFSPTNTPVPTLTFTPTTTPISMFYQRGFDTPIGDYYKFIIHKAKDGERLEDFAQKYNTTVDAVIAINYHLTNPVWEDVLFVVPINFSNMEGMPVFVVYKIKLEERGISVDALAKKLRVDLFDLKYYNGMMTPGQRPLVGDLILVPWPDDNRKIQFDEPDQWGW